MAKPALSMKPTGWFQVAWAAEIVTGEVKSMKYFGQEMIAFRGAGGKVYVMDAYCEHLGAHLGFGGTVRGESIVCPFHGWEWSAESGRNTDIPYQDKPNRARKIRTWDVVEINESIYLWHDVEGRKPFFDAPDIFDVYEDGRKAQDYYLAYPEGCIHEAGLELHPQYVMENGVDYAHFKFVHRAVEMPKFTRQAFDDHHFYADFEMTFGLTKEKTVMTPEGAIVGGVNAINIGVGLGYAKFWGPDNMRTIVTVTPVDDETADIRSTVWLERGPGDSSERLPETMNRRMKLANNQFLADLAIWRHQRYTSPPGLATAEGKGFRALRQWCTRFYPDGQLGADAQDQEAGLEAGPNTPDSEALSTA